MSQAAIAPGFQPEQPQDRGSSSGQEQNPDITLLGGEERRGKGPTPRASWLISPAGGGLGG